MEKRLRKGRDRILFGVCSGLAEYFEVDPTIVRLLFLVAFVLEPKIVILYILLAVVMPDGEGRYEERKILAYGLIGLGLLMILKDVLPVLFEPTVFGIILVALGLLLLKRL